VALVAGVQFRQPGYKAMSLQWHAGLRRSAVRAHAMALALALTGCSFSYQLDNLFAKRDESAAEQTGTSSLVNPKPAAEPPAEGDLVIARAAASEVLSKGGKDVSIPWENPHTGARGTITPLASVYSQDGLTCRDFLASYVRNGGESWLHGAACRGERGKWVVRNLRPWKNT
jgi:hypothetical protein